ncbi:MAG: transcriptional activator RfaH [Pseudomonadota bacterium]
MGARWYLVHAKTRAETVADLNLRRQGYRTFLPQEARTVRHARKTQVKLAAVFPGYLFVSLDPDRDRWTPINSTYGVLRLVRAAERPTPVPNGLVESLIDAAEEGGVLDLVPELAVGDRVRVRRGPFADFIAEVADLTPPDRVKVLFNAMQNAAPVELPAADCVRTLDSAWRPGRPKPAKPRNS